MKLCSINSVPKNHWLVRALLGWFTRNARDLPWRRTPDPYAIWVSEIMLQQTQVKTVISYWERWMRELPTIESLANASSEKIHKLWEGLGYYTRVRNMQKAAQQIVATRRAELCDAEDNGDSRSSSLRFPEDFDDVLALPGIGRYTAGAICSIAFNQPTPILDGNVIRVLTRIFGITQNPREKKTNARLWRLAEELVLHASRITHHVQRISRTRTRTKDGDKTLGCSHLNQSLMELGALICTPRQPNCVECPAASCCAAFKRRRTDKIPNLGSRRTSTDRHFAAFVLRNNGHIFVRQRPAKVVNAHLWEFPNAELNGTHPNLETVARETIGCVPRQLRRFCSIRHTITRYRITLDAFESFDCARIKSNGHWLKLSELQKLAFPSAHKKILARLIGEQPN